MHTTPSQDSGGFTPAPGVIATDLGDELILLDPDRGEMFSLNGSGRSVWQALKCGADPVEALTGTFEVEEEVARAEANALILALVAAGLLLPIGVVDGRGG